MRIRQLSTVLDGSRDGRLRRTIDGIVSLVLASSAFACGGAEEPSRDKGGPSATTVEDGPRIACATTMTAMLASATTTRPVDFMEMRVRGARRGLTEPEVRAIGTRGTACAAAIDVAACRAKLDGLKLPEGEEGGWSAIAGSNVRRDVNGLRYLVYTAGDEVGIVETTEALKELLAPIDTYSDARLLLWTDEIEMSCASEPPSTEVRHADGSFEFQAPVMQTCPGERNDVPIRVAADGTVDYLTNSSVSRSGGCGRRPTGLDPPALRGACSEVGALFAEMAHLEAASIIAFARLREELASLGAPEALLLEAERARQDEIRHARMTARLARRFGGSPPPVRIAPKAHRSMFEIALENAVEGCVRETYGALVARWQSRTAADLAVRSAFAEIAADEARHAELAWAVARWIEPQFDDARRRIFDHARAVALEQLRLDVAAPVHAERLHVAGMPGHRAATALVAELQAEVYAQVA